MLILNFFGAKAIIPTISSVTNLTELHLVTHVKKNKPTLLGPYLTPKYLSSEHIPFWFKRSIRIILHGHTSVKSGFAFFVLVSESGTVILGTRDLFLGWPTEMPCACVPWFTTEKKKKRKKNREDPAVFWFLFWDFVLFVCLFFPWAKHQLTQRGSYKSGKILLPAEQTRFCRTVSAGLTRGKRGKTKPLSTPGFAL